MEQQLPPINKELEYFANQNSIDSAGKDDSVYALESALTGCVSKQSIGKLHFRSVQLVLVQNLFHHMPYVKRQLNI